MVCSSAPRPSGDASRSVRVAGRKSGRWSAMCAGWAACAPSSSFATRKPASLPIRKPKRSLTIAMNTASSLSPRAPTTTSCVSSCRWLLAMSSSKKASTSSKRRWPPSRSTSKRRFLTHSHPQESGEILATERGRATMSDVQEFDMQNTVANSTSAATELKDPRLFREACYVDGQWVQGSSGQMISVDNPGTGEIIGKVPRLGGAETRQAIEAANRAFPAWSKRTAKERALVLRRWFDLMMANQEDLARLMTLEQGKPLSESRGEVAYAAAFLEWFGEEAKRVYGDTIPQHQADKRIVVIKQAIGVVACITPWNFPLAMITRKAGPAIGAGCTVVLKPASQTPFSALALAELAERAGVPKGVFNILTGSATEIGGELTSNPIVRKLSFTGSTEVGKVLMAQGAGTVKKLSLEREGTRRSLFLMTPISTLPLRAQWLRSTATQDKPASARTDCWCRRAYTMHLQKNFPWKSKL